MSETGSNPLPSRRALRQQGLTTGAIDSLTETGSIPTQQPAPATPVTPAQAPAAASQTGPITTTSGLPQPQSRRERREQERLIATGAIPVVTDQTPPPAPATPVAEPTPPAAAPAVSAPAPPADADSTRLLTRRERRAMEERGEPVPATGRIPVVTDEGLAAANAPAERAITTR